MANARPSYLNTPGEDAGGTATDDGSENSSESGRGTSDEDSTLGNESESEDDGDGTREEGDDSPKDDGSEVDGSEADGGGGGGSPGAGSEADGGDDSSVYGDRDDATWATWVSPSPPPSPPPLPPASSAAAASATAASAAAASTPPLPPGSSAAAASAATLAASSPSHLLPSPPPKQQGQQSRPPSQKQVLPNCVYCYRVFDPAESRGCGSVADLRGRSCGALEIADSDRFCDFIAEHPGWERASRGGARFWTCCGTEVGTTFGCHVCVVPHTTLQNDPLRLRLLAPWTAPAPPQVQDRPIERMRPCFYCHMMFNANMPRRVGGITDLDRSRDGRCMAILDTSEFCDFVVEHPGPVCKGRSYAYYACCKAEVGTNFGCRCIVVQHSEKKDDYRPKVLQETR